MAFESEDILEKMDALEHQQDVFADQQDVLIDVLKEMSERLQRIGQVSDANIHVKTMALFR